MKKKSPVKKHNQNFIVNHSSVLPIQNNGIPNIFKTQQEEFFYKQGRAHCQAIERTAIYTDAHGNRIVLKENSTTMNTDNNGSALTYNNNGRVFKKKRKC